jgi:hypothetical protein
MNMVSSGYFYFLAIKEYKKWLKIVVKPTETDNFLCLKKLDRKRYHNTENKKRLVQNMHGGCLTISRI